MESETTINILVVDDHAENLVTLRAVLADDQYHVVTATSGIEALRFLLHEEFAVVLLDVQMPELDGFETAHLIRARDRTRHTPIIFLTAISTDRTHVARGYSLGAVDYLFKPFDPEILKAKVASFVELARKTRELEEQVRQRELAEEEVRALNQRLEERVTERTRALKNANRELRSEIAERKRAEEAREGLLLALVAGEERYRALADAMPQLVWTATADGAMDYVNDRWVEYTGLSAPESNGSGWLAALHPDDVAPTVERWKSTVQSGQVFELACRFRRASDGMYRWHLSRAFPQKDASGGICRWLGTCTDIDDQKRIEDSLQFLAEASKLLAQSLDYEASLAQVAGLAVPWFADWCFVDLHDHDMPRRLSITHIDPEQQQVAWGLWKAQREEDRPLLGPAMVMQSGQPELLNEISDPLLAALTGDTELARARKLGFCSYMSVPVRTRERVIGVFTFVTAESRRQYGPGDLEIAADLALRVGFALENARLFREVQDAGAAKDRFLAMLGHELRNPLAPIRNAVAAMRVRGVTDPAVERHREIIERQAGHLNRIVDDLLDVARITQGKIELRRRPVDLVEVVRHSINGIWPSVRERGHHLEMELAAGPIWLDADPTRLEQVLTNLLTNAVKYTGAGGKIWVSLRIEANAGEGRPDTAVVTVRDSGVGISAQELLGIFEPFAQAERAPDRAQGGLGLGLTVVRDLVEMHGGRVEARSEGAGRGSEFEVRLPVSGLPPQVCAAEKTPEMPAVFGAVPARVLVVDDNLDAAETLAELLCLWGYDVETAMDGERGLAAAERFAPDLVLLDIGLPGIDGYEVARRLRRAEMPDAPRGRNPDHSEREGLQPLILVAVTGYGQADDHQRSKAAGFDYHLAKPVDPDSLRELISRELIRLRKKPSELTGKGVR